MCWCAMTSPICSPVSKRCTAPHRTAPHRTAPHRTAPHQCRVPCAVCRGLNGLYRMPRPSMRTSSLGTPPATDSIPCAHEGRHTAVCRCGCECGCVGVWVCVCGCTIHLEDGAETGSNQGVFRRLCIDPHAFRMHNAPKALRVSPSARTMLPREDGTAVQYGLTYEHTSLHCIVQLRGGARVWCSQRGGRTPCSEADATRTWEAVAFPNILCSPGKLALVNFSLLPRSFQRSSPHRPSFLWGQKVVNRDQDHVIVVIVRCVPFVPST